MSITPAATPAASYPATFDIDAPEHVANWRPLVQWFLAIPHLVVVQVLGYVAEVIAFISWIIVLFTGKLPDGLANFQVMYFRYQIRAYSYAGFLREEYPPFAFGMTPDDDGLDPRIRVNVHPELEQRNRLTVAFRIILAIPQVFVLALLAIAAWFCFVIAFFAVLFTGKWPDGLRDFVVKVMRWGLRVQAYVFLLTDLYPPFALE
jgi:hypothetical protein